jgi:hypothetical protein
MINEYVINARRVSDRRLEYTWTPNPFPGAPSTLWVEYPFDVARIKGHDVFYPVLPLFLAFGFADTRFHLASKISGPSGADDQGAAFQQVLANWLDIVEAEAVENFGKRIHAEADVDGQTVTHGTPSRASAPVTNSGTAIFYGGGAESLLTLAELTDQKLKPHLISYLGPGWIGSDPAKNENKVLQDQMVARELGLNLHHVHSNIYGLFAQMQNALCERMVVDAFFVNRIPFMPMLVSLFAPLGSVHGLGAVYHVHEKHLDADLSFHCFTKPFTDKLAQCFSPKLAYRRMSWDLPKVDVVEKLCTQYPSLLKYQYSCFNNEHERWCFRCEKCLRYYLFFKLFDVPLATVEFDEVRMLRDFASFHAEIASHVWSEWYPRDCYTGILTRARARGKKDVEEFLLNLIGEAKRIERKKKAQALIRPLVPKSVRRLVKGFLPAPLRGTAHA